MARPKTNGSKDSTATIGLEANPDTGPGDVDHLLPEYEKLLAQIAETRNTLKAQLMEALSR